MHIYIQLTLKEKEKKEEKKKQIEQNTKMIRNIYGNYKMYKERKKN